MRTNLTTGSVGIGWLAAKIAARQQKRLAESTADAINNLSRLYQLKKEGVLTDQEFAELKERIKERI